MNKSRWQLCKLRAVKEIGLDDACCIVVNHMGSGDEESSFPKVEKRSGPGQFWAVLVRRLPKGADTLRSPKSRLHGLIVMGEAAIW